MDQSPAALRSDDALETPRGVEYAVGSPVSPPDGSGCKLPPPSKPMPSINPQLVESYRRDGFLVVQEMLTAEELAQLRERTAAIASGQVDDYPDQEIELEPTAGGLRSLATVRKLNKCQSDPVFAAHAGHERILDFVEAIIGPDIKLYGMQTFMKPPGGVEKPYHQDSAYFPVQPMELVTCWTALDDVTLENGCLWVIRGSHREGLVEHSQPWQVGSRLDMRIPAERIAVDRAVPMTMPAGGCSFHHSLILHSSGPNRTLQSRRGVAVHYTSAQSRWVDASVPPPRCKLLRGRPYAGCI